MAEGRMLLKKTSLSEDLADLTSDTFRMLYTWAIPHLDIDGRMEGTARKFKAAVCPMLDHITFEIIEGFFAEITQKKLVVIYEIHGKTVIWFPKFRENQPGLRPEKEAKSKLPECTPDLLRNYSVPTPELVRTCSARKHKNGTDQNGTERNGKDQTLKERNVLLRNSSGVDESPSSSLASEGSVQRQNPVLPPSFQSLIDLLPDKYLEDAKVNRLIRESLLRYSGEYMKAQILYVVEKNPSKNFRGYLADAIAKNFAGFDVEEYAREVARVKDQERARSEQEMVQAEEDERFARAKGLLETMNHTERIKLKDELLMRNPVMAAVIKPVNEQTMLIGFLAEKLRGELTHA
ncbi:MAG: hypothetical protein ABFD97_20305 [Syntrophobacter sp.]